MMLSGACSTNSIYVSMDDRVLNVGFLVFYYYEYSEIMLKLKH